MAPSLGILAFLQNIGMMEMIVIGLVALLLFGRRLPEVGRSLGKGIVEFKKGLRDVEDDVGSAGSGSNAQRPNKPDNSKKDETGSTGTGG